MLTKARAILCLSLVILGSNELSAESNWNPEVWENVPGSRYFRVYIFNVTNPNEIESSYNKPILREVGPYVYRETSTKFNTSQNFADSSVNYRNLKSFEFQPDLSNTLSESDLLTVVNTQLIIYATRLILAGTSPRNGILNQLTNQDETLIQREQLVREILFEGLNASKYLAQESWLDPIDDPFPPGFEAFADGRYGLLKGLNNSNDGLFRASPGPAARKGNIISWDDKAALDWWGEGKCNRVEGSTDGSLFNSNVNDDEGLDVFLPQICRSVHLDFNKVVTGPLAIQLKRFVISASALEDPAVNPENQCFCTKSDFMGTGCVKRGAIHVGPCKLGAPYAVSFPHFMNADGGYSQGVSGLSAAPSIHETFYDVEPLTGAVIASRIRIQWNIRHGPISDLEYFQNVPEILFPLFWAEESFDMDGDSLVGLKAFLNNGGSSTERVITEAGQLTTTVTTPLPGTTFKPIPTTASQGDELSSSPTPPTVDTSNSILLESQIEWISRNIDKVLGRLNMLSIFIVLTIALLGVSGTLFVYTSRQKRKSSPRVLDGNISNRRNSYPIWSNGQQSFITISAPEQIRKD